MLQFAAFLFRKKQWSTVSRKRCMQNLDLLTSRAVKTAELEKRKMSSTLKTWERMHNARWRSASPSVAPGLHVQPRRTWERLCKTKCMQKTRVLISKTSIQLGSFLSMFVKSWSNSASTFLYKKEGIDFELVSLKLTIFLLQQEGVSSLLFFLRSSVSTCVWGIHLFFHKVAPFLYHLTAVLCFMTGYKLRIKFQLILSFFFKKKHLFCTAFDKKQSARANVSPNLRPGATE